MATLRTMNYRHGRTMYSNLAIESYYYAGRIEEGLALLQESEAFIAVTGERIVQARLYELRGQLLQSQGQLSEAEASFSHAITLARQRHAKGAELRVATLLSRLWLEQGKQDKIPDLLLPIYNSFTEGFDTPELQEAKALLDTNLA